MTERSERRKPGFMAVLESWMPNKVKLVSGLFFILFWVLSLYAFPLQLVSDNLYLKVYSPMLLLADMVILLLGLMTIRNRWDIAVIVSYLIISVISSMLVNHLSLTFYLNGCRLYFCMLFLPPMFRWLLEKRERAEYFIHTFDRQLYIFLWLQLPTLTLQMLLYGAGDRGGGTFGNLFSGAISTLIYSISFYLMTRRWDDSKTYVANLLANWKLIFLLAGTFMNETKISFIFLLLYFLLLVPFDKKFLRNLLVIIPAVVGLLVLAGYVYVHTNRNQADAALILDPEFLEYYVMGDETTYDLLEYASTSGYIDDSPDFMRGAKYAMVPAAIIYKPYGPWIGYGVSQFKGGSSLDTTDFYKRFEWFLHGTNTQVIQIFIDMGGVGIVWMLFWCAVQFGWIGKKPGKRSKRLQLYYTAMILMSIVYMNYLSLQTFMLIFLYLCMLSARWNLVEDTRRMERIAAQNPAV